MKLKLLLILAVHCSMLHAQHVWTYDECIQYAIDHNIDIQQKVVNIDMRKNELNNVQNEWLPSVTLDAAQRFSFGNALASTGTMASTTDRLNSNLAYTNASVNVELTLFDGFRRTNQQRSGRWAVQQATASLDYTRKSLTIQIATLYLQVLYDRGIMQVARAQVETSRQLCEKTKTFVDDGRKPQSDLADARAQLAADEYEFTQAEGRYKIALLTLSQLLNLETVEGFDIADMADEALLTAPVPLTLDPIPLTLENFPSILAAKASVEKSRYDIATARAGYYPKLDFRASLNTYYLNLFNQPSPPPFAAQLWDNKSQVVGLHLTMPLFNRFATRNSIRKAKMNFTQSQLALQDTRQQLRKEIHQAYYNAVNAQSKYFSAKKSEEASQLSSEFEKEKYEAGRSTIYDLTQAYQRLRKSREDALQAKYEIIIRRKILEVYNQQ